MVVKMGGRVGQIFTAFSRGSADRILSGYAGATPALIFAPKMPTVGGGRCDGQTAASGPLGALGRWAKIPPIGGENTHPSEGYRGRGPGNQGMDASNTPS